LEGDGSAAMFAAAWDEHGRQPSVYQPDVVSARRSCVAQVLIYDIAEVGEGGVVVSATLSGPDMPAFDPGDMVGVPVDRGGEPVLLRGRVGPSDRKIPGEWTFRSSPMQLGAGGA